MDCSQTPLWMQDDLVKDIPREKLEFLSTLFAKGHGKTQKEMQAAITAIKKYSSEAELQQIQNILEKSKVQRNNSRQA